jgi:hypothetical protein
MDRRVVRLLVSLLLLLAQASLASCGSDPADVSGTYTVNLTNGPNQCELSGWTVGESSTAIPVVITQDGASIEADVQGGTGVYLDLIVGSSTFTGTVSGTHLDLELVGRAGSMGSCAYTWRTSLDADLDGDVLTGQLVWYADTNSSAECGIYATCRNTQSMNGARPPTGD